jgi:hypothetical protein
MSTKLPNATLGDEMTYREPSAVTPRCDAAEVAAAAALSLLDEADLAAAGPLPAPSVVSRRRVRRWFERARLAAVALVVAALVVLAAALGGYGAAVARRPTARPGPFDLGGLKLVESRCDPDVDFCRVTP